MSIMKSPTGFTVSLLLSIIVPAIAAAQSSGQSFGESTGLEDMVGARAGQAEAEVRRRGYANIRAEQGDGRAYSYWWNAERRQCIVIATMEGRYNSIQSTTSPDCRKAANVTPTPSYPVQPGYQTDPASVRPPYRPGATQPGYPAGGPVVAGRAVGLGLVCFGDGSRSGIASGTTWTWNRDRDRYEYGTYSQTTRDVFDASLMVQTWDGGGRIRLPRSLIPPHQLARQQWLVGPLRRRRRSRRHPCDLPPQRSQQAAHHDRSRTGRITVQGTASYGFRGSCDVIGHEPRRF